jgi:NAD(P)-dependent dehydrogenase (short-subunit alcohol dehydrogenase family)
MGGSYAKPAEIKSKHFPEFKAGLPRMEGKVVAITGCTTGTGFICAKTCAELGASVIMLNRASSRSESALADLREAVPGCSAKFIACDLMSFDSVRKAGAELRKELDGGLDVLCNNAGIMAVKDEATVDGCDTQMQTNHLSHFLLTAEVWPLLETAVSLRGEARVVNHSSVARNGFGKGNKLQEKYLLKNGGNLGGDGMFWWASQRWARYQQTKLANLVFTYALRDRQDRVKVLVAHPGFAATNLQVTTASDGGMGHFSSKHSVGMMAQSCEDGTMGILKCCCEPGVTSGDFYGPGAGGFKGKAELIPAGPEEALADQASRQMLWKASCEVTGASFPF